MSHEAPQTPADIKAYVREAARRREGEFAYIYSGENLVIGTSNEEGMWDVFTCKVLKSDGGYEPKSQPMTVHSRRRRR